MGHTVWSQRQVVDIIIAELADYGKALKSDDKAIYDDMLKLTYKHFASISSASSMHVWAFILLSIILEQEKKIRRLEK